MADATKIGVADATKMGVANARVAYLLPPLDGLERWERALMYKVPTQVLLSPGREQAVFGRNVPTGKT